MQEPSSQTAKEILLQAFEMFRKNSETVMPVVDQILIAATKTSRIEIEPVLAEQLAVTLSEDETMKVSIPGGLSAFRAMLARIGVICSAAAQKHSLMGKIKTTLKRVGLVADKTVTERKDRAIEYVSAVVRDEPGSPLYKVDADLKIKQPNGMTTPLHLVMQNETKKLFLLIELRKNGSGPAK